MGDLELDSLLMAFADDSKVVSKINSENDIMNMQINMDSIYEWHSSNNMKFNFG